MFWFAVPSSVVAPIGPVCRPVAAHCLPHLYAVKSQEGDLFANRGGSVTSVGVGGRGAGVVRVWSEGAELLGGGARGRVVSRWGLGAELLGCGARGGVVSRWGRGAELLGGGARGRVVRGWGEGAELLGDGGEGRSC